ncbi:uncharacterized protein LOC143220408 [Lasioglossum baleicum]|uniref:uncharacterized protein LOC143220408 n=1 Tax=Lasioglossum baleicum TaxID=434251 RepID=UPI003FCD618B
MIYEEMALRAEEGVVAVEGAIERLGFRVSPKRPRPSGFTAGGRTGFATGYRTLTHEAAAVLAGLPPLDLLVAAAARTYGLLRRCRVEKPCLGFEELDEIEEMKREIWRSAMKRRQGRLRRPESARHRAVGPIATVLDDWMRGGSSRTFRLTQVLSGHGCFGEYLHKIGKEVTPGFWHCEAEVHSAQDILAECPAWAP